MSSAKWWDALPRPVYAGLEPVETQQSWFEVYRVEPDIFVLYESGHFEENICYLVLGKERAALIDTGLGIGDIRELVDELTELPVSVINTHSHWDHISQNYMFEDVAMFENESARNSQAGIQGERAQRFIGGDRVWKPFPNGFKPELFTIHPFKVTRWLHDAETIDLGGRRLEVVHTPGHSPDSICFLDEEAALLWTGDTFYPAPLYAHGSGSNIQDYIQSLTRLLGIYSKYETLMPGHNEPCVEKSALKDALQAFLEITNGIGEYVEVSQNVRRYDYERFSIMIRADSTRKA